MELGVGLTFSSGLEPALAHCGKLIDVLEVEPQTFWYSGASAEDAPRLDREYLECVAAMPFPMLVHGLGFPVGGTEEPNSKQLPVLTDTLASLNPHWFSEHLSFNRARRNGRRFHTAFLLPPCQNEAGVEVACRSIRALQQRLNVPLAIEIGANYLRPMAHEMKDGEFIARIVEATGCGLLLDPYNLYANECNGRQSVQEFLDSIPLEQVWELHMAGAVLDESYAISRSLVRSLPNLGAIIYETFPGNLVQGSLEIFTGHLTKLRRLWDQRGKNIKTTTNPRNTAPGLRTSPVAPEVWEDTLGAMVSGLPVTGPLADLLANDHGIPLIIELICEFRGSVLLRNLKITCSLLMIELGDPGFVDLFKGFWEKATPALFGSGEARHFAEYLRMKKLDIRGLNQVLSFELATIETLTDGCTRTVSFDFDPFPVISALSEGRKPSLWNERQVTLEILPGGIPVGQRDTANGLQLLH